MCVYSGKKKALTMAICGLLQSNFFQSYHSCFPLNLFRLFCYLSRINVHSILGITGCVYVCVCVSCSGLSDALNQLTSDVADASSQLSGERRNRIITALDSINRWFSCIVLLIMYSIILVFWYSFFKDVMSLIKSASFRFGLYGFVARSKLAEWII